MKYITYFFLSLSALLHIVFFKIESIDFMKPEVLARFKLNETSGSFVRVWAFNQGFYNLFLAIGLFYSLYLLYKKEHRTGKTLANFILLTIVGAGCVLYFSAPNSTLGAALQAMPALFGFLSLNIFIKRLNLS